MSGSSHSQNAELLGLRRWYQKYHQKLTNILSHQVWQIANNVDIEGGKTPLGKRFPFLEVDTIVKSSDIGDGNQDYHF